MYWPYIAFSEIEDERDQAFTHLNSIPNKLGFNRMKEAIYAR